MALKTPAFNDAKSYGFEWLRSIFEAALQEGVLNMGGAGTDFKVTAAAAGGMRVDVAAGAALVKGDSGVAALGLSQGLALAINDAAIANAVTLDAAHGSLPRIDQLVLHWYDSSDLGTGADQFLLEKVTGVAQGGATLDNRNGAAALPNDCLRLADILVPAGSTATSAGNIRDRRPWARGAHFTMTGSQNGTDYTTASGVGANIDSTNLAKRIELSGVPCEFSVFANLKSSVAADEVQLMAQTDGSDLYPGRRPVFGVANTWVPIAMTTVLSLVAGSKLAALQWSRTVGSGTISARNFFYEHIVFMVREQVRPNANNN